MPKWSCVWFNSDCYLWRPWLTFGHYFSYRKLQKASMSIYTVQVMYEVRNSYRNSMYYRISLERLLEVAFFDQSHKPSFTNTYTEMVQNRDNFSPFRAFFSTRDLELWPSRCDIRTWPRKGRDESLWEVFRSKVISFDRYRPTNTYTDTRTHSRPTPVQSLKHKCH